MCAPTLYDVDYVINPWMVGNVHAPSRERAMAQWEELYRAVSRVAEVELVEPVAGSPDMVFTANAGLEHGGTVVLSSFLHTERQGEEEHFKRWFAGAGYRVMELPREVAFEGEGDALFSLDGRRLWAGFGPRTGRESHPLVAEALSVEVGSLRLVDPRFYHLDTCFAPLADGSAMYYAKAFDAESLWQIEAYYAPGQRIVVDEEDAACFCCNAVNVDTTVILNQVSTGLAKELSSRGFEVVQVDLGEFLKAGGAAKCLVMKVAQPAWFPVE